jgi:NADH-quinone oxidoreductase subunit L
MSLHNWYMEEAYRKTFVRPGVVLTQVAQWLDTKIIDKLVDYTGIAVVVAAHMVAWADRTLVDGTVKFFVFIAGRIGLLTRAFQGGKVQYYFVYTLLGLILLIVWIIL